MKRLSCFKLLFAVAIRDSKSFGDQLWGSAEK
jgi:hypothetical protein